MKKQNVGKLLTARQGISKIVTFALVFGLLGGYMIVRSFAATPGSCTTTLSSGASISSALSTAAAGDNICLNAGTYAGWSTNVSKASMTTVKAAPGVTAAQVTVGSVSFGSSQNITIDGVTIDGISTSGSSAARHIYVRNSIFTGPASINTPDSSNMDILIDHNTFNNVESGCNEGRISICGDNVNHTSNNGVVISNNDLLGELGGSNCSDGIQLNGGAYGTQILNNVFHNLKEGNCTQHADPLQFYGGINTLIDGNYFYGNSTGIMSGDGNGSPMTVTNNVFVTDGEYEQQLVIGGGSGDIVTHNTFANGASIRIGKVNVGFSSNETVKDNVLTGGFWFSESQTTAGFTIDYNLIPGGGGGTHGVTGSPTYTGGASPSTLAGYLLASGSLGHLAASDGTDMGAVINSSDGGGVTKLGDFNSDGVVNIYDLGIFLSKWQSTTAAAQDFNSDGVVNIYDLGAFLSHYGS